MKPEHTPGPWEVDSEQVYAKSEDYVAVVPMEYRKDGLLTDEDRANLRLIAAAPDLLAALEGMTKEFGNQRFKVRQDFSKMVQIEAARAAITKAKGGV